MPQITHETLRALFGIGSETPNNPAITYEVVMEGTLSDGDLSTLEPIKEWERHTRCGAKHPIGENIKATHRCSPTKDAPRGNYCNGPIYLCDEHVTMLRALYAEDESDSGPTT